LWSKLVKPLGVAPDVKDTISHYGVLVLTHNVIGSKIHCLLPVRKSDLCVTQTQEDCDLTIGVTWVTIGVTGVTIGVVGVIIRVTGVALEVTGVTYGLQALQMGLQAL